MAFIYDLSDTWNAGATTFTAIKMNVTDTASASGSKLIDLQVGGTTRFDVDKNGQVEISAGTALLPSLSTLGDTNTGMWFPAADTVALSTAGSERVRITSAGRVGISTTVPDALLSVNGIASFGAGTAALPSVAAFGDLDTGMWFPAANTVAWSTSGSERIRMLSDGKLIFGYTASLSNQFTTATFQVHAQGGGSTMDFFRFSADNGGVDLFLNKSRGAGAPNQAIVNNGDILGSLRFTGSDGTGFVQGALIRCEVDGTPGANDMPGRLAFWTTADGGSIPTERMRITSAGNVGIGTSTFGTSAVRSFAIATGTAPTTGPADTIQIYSTDLTAGNTMLSLYTEGTIVNTNTTAATTHRIAIRVNGTVYYLLANTAA